MNRALALDSSVAVPLLVRTHPHHQEVRTALRGPLLALCGHALAEVYAVLTRLPGSAAVAPADAVSLIEDRFGPPYLLAPQTSARLPQVLAAAGVAGGATYDALVALAALEHGALLVTRDRRARSTYERIGASTRLLESAGREQI